MTDTDDDIPQAATDEEQRAALRTLGEFQRSSTAYQRDGEDRCEVTFSIKSKSRDAKPEKKAIMGALTTIGAVVGSSAKGRDQKEGISWVSVVMTPEELTHLEARISGVAGKE